MAGGWLGVKSMPLEKRAQLTLQGLITEKLSRFLTYKLQGICFLHKSGHLVLSCYEAGFVLYFVRIFIVRLVLHGITSHALNHFG